MLFFRKTVDSILSAMNKNIADLQNFAVAEWKRSADEHSRAAALTDSAMARGAQARRAEVVAEKLTALIG